LTQPSNAFVFPADVMLWVPPERYAVHLSLMRWNSGEFFTPR